MNCSSQISYVVLVKNHWEEEGQKNGTLLCVIKHIVCLPSIYPFPLFISDRF